MFKNYILSAWRNIIRQRLSSVINIGGLAIGLASFILIFLYIQKELNYDKHWEDVDKVYRISESIDYGKRAADYALSPFPLAPSLQKYFPELKQLTRISRASEKTPIEFNNQIFNIPRVHYADSNFFKIFNYTFIEGSKKNALNNPNDIVISKKIANKFFGENQAIGKTFKINEKTYTVTGVIHAHQHPSHLQPNILRSTLSFPKSYLKNMNGDWTYIGYYTYIKFQNEPDIRQFKDKLSGWHKQTIEPWLSHHELTYKLDFKLQPLDEIHFLTAYDYDLPSNINDKYLYIFGYVAFFILLIVSINYINLSTAKAANRYKEVGIRKTLGAKRQQLIKQFLGESVMLSLIAMVLGIALTEVLLPVFNSLTGQELTFIEKLNEPYGLVNLFIILGVSLLVGTASGIFPAFVMSNFSSLQITGKNLLSGKQAKKTNQSTNLRKTLVIAQFIVTISMIIATLVVYNQIQFMQNKSLGFNKERMVIIDIPSHKPLRQNLETIKNEMKQIPEVENAVSSMDFPGFQHGRLTFYIEKNGKYRQEMINYYRVGENFHSALDIKVKEGRFFSRDYPSDPSSAIVINEAAKKIFGENPIGQKVKCGLGVDGQIIGVIEDFNYASLHKRIHPLVMLYTPQKARFLGVKIKNMQIPETLKDIEQTWKQFDSKHPYVYQFLDDQFDSQYKREEKMMSIFGYFSILTILLACLGLFGLSAFMAEKKRKEIGIRKALGSTSKSIVVKFMRQYMVWLVLSNAIAWPLAFWAMNKWLENFAYRISIQSQSFLIAAIVTLILALGTISYHAIKAANTNPAETLRDE